MFVFLSRSPWYNHNGWLGVKHQVTCLTLLSCTIHVRLIVMFVFTSPALFWRQHHWNFRAAYADLSFQRLVFPLAGISCCWLEAWNLHQSGVQQQTFRVLCLLFFVYQKWGPTIPMLPVSHSVPSQQSAVSNQPLQMRHVQVCLMLCQRLLLPLPPPLFPYHPIPPAPPTTTPKTTNQPTNNKKIKPKRPPSSSSFEEVSMHPV